MIEIAIWVLLSIAVPVIAKRRGQSALGFFAIPLLLTPLIGLLFVFVVRPNPARNGQR